MGHPDPRRLADMSFTHVVMFKWKDESFDAQPVAEALQAAVAAIDGVQSYVCGTDVNLSPGSFDFAVVGTFDDRDSFLAYRDNPEHQRIIKEMINPHLESRSVAQLES
jgi:quinol monooxygenase YgiN